MKKILTLLSIIPLLLLVACTKEPSVDPLQRAYIDNLNKEAFVCRYRDPQQSIFLSQKAVQYIDDSLPTYLDGKLRALNNLAFGNYLLCNNEQTEDALSSIDRLHLLKSRNADIEHTISLLLKARLLQRKCQIAQSYQLIDSLQRHKISYNGNDNLLFNYAYSEYYITLLTLSYYYRDGSESNATQLIADIESQKDLYRVDYAEDLALNYAIAYGYYCIGEHRTALQYCEKNYDILDLGDIAYCPYQYANTLQMTAHALQKIPEESSPDSILALYDLSRHLFFEIGNPYQMLGGTNSTARYALLIGDTAYAKEVLKEWLNASSSWEPYSVPMMESSLYDLLIRSRYSNNLRQNILWYSTHNSLQQIISQSTRDDFLAQQTIAIATRQNHQRAIVINIIIVFVVLLLILSLLLWRTTIRLRREKRQLEEQKKKDIERIAAVETCLSVMRHDISPYVGYLSNPSLSTEIRNKLIEKLLRTFSNLKHWTSLSIPKHLTFHASVFPLQDIFNDLGSQIATTNTNTQLLFQPTSTTLWGDYLLVNILLRNIIQNALQNTPSGKVGVSAQQQGNFIDISIQDSGIGMTEEKRKQLFSSDRAIEGEHGFGMILCRHIVAKHDELTLQGCSLSVESTPNHGTTVIVRLANGNNKHSTTP